MKPMDRNAMAKLRTNRKHASLRQKPGRTGSAESRARAAQAVGLPANDVGPDGSVVDVELPEVIDAAALALDADTEGETELVPVAATTVDGDAAAEPDSPDEVIVPDGEDVERAAKGDDEPQSFLAMYFRDMAELEVLRPEQEFETARQIEELELELWRLVLGFAAGASWLADTVEKAMEKELPEFKDYRASATRAAGKAGAAARGRFDKLLVDLAIRLKEVDADRIFVEAAVAEIHRVGRAGERGVRGEPTSAFASTRAFQTFWRAVTAKHLRVKHAKNEFVKANLRLVVSIARRFNHGRLPLPDLIQEGNIGLMKAVERYDYRRGFRFSTYASWWIRHAISRALADKGRAVRLPVHMIDAYHRIAKSERELQSKLERPATIDEIASATGIESDKLEKMKTFLSETPVSLDRPISDDDGRRLIDVLVDPNEAASPPDQMVSSETQKEMLQLLGALKPIEADILRKRFGLLNDHEKTLKEIGDEYRLSRERVRQLQEQALGKMRRAMAKLEAL